MMPATCASSTADTALQRIPRSPSTVRFTGDTATTSRLSPRASASSGCVRSSSVSSSTGSTTE